MRAIVYRPSIRRVSGISLRVSLPLLMGCGLLCALGSGCQGRFRSPLAGYRALDDSAPWMHGPSLAGPSSIRTQPTHQNLTQNSSAQVRITREDAIPETDIAPVPQRLTPTHSVGGSPSTRQVSRRTQSDVGADRGSEPPQQDPPATLSPAAAEIAPVSHVASFSDHEPATTLELPAGYDGVDVSDLMTALQDSPPEVQKAAIARLIAMSRSRARATTQPQSIDEALAAAFDSLPELPDEVVDRGVSPTRIGESKEASAAASSTATRVAFSDQEPQSTQPIAAAWASAKAGRQPVDDRQKAAPIPAVDADAEGASNISLATIQIPVANQSQDPAPDDQAGDLLPSSGQLDDVALAAPGPAEMTDAELYDALVARLKAKVPGESDAERHRRQVVARHLMVLAGDPDRAVENLEGLSHQEQEYLRHQLLGLWTIIDPKGHPVPSRRFSSALPEIRKATSFLAAASDSLEVRGLEFCTEIEAYGQVKPFPNRRFAAGQEVILYCEIDNFVSQSAKGGFETRLQGSYDLLDASGQRVSSQTLPEDHQVSKNRLRDYFIAYQMYLPDSIEPGAYQLRLTMEDVHGKKYGQSTIDFEIKP